MMGETDKEIHVITGGGGYPGFRLGKQLIHDGHLVRLLDIREPTSDLLDGMEFIKGDIRKLEDVNKAFKDSTIVYHMASFGMSGRDQLNKKLIEEINIGGTENVIKACYENNIKRLVYTSTYNVVFGGEEIINGDESLPYLSDHKFTDQYSKTKREGEEKILAVNNTVTSDGHSTLYTCALRLAGVYGPGEQRHLPRIVSYIERGLTVVIYGAKESKVDFLHVDNLVQGHILAGQALSHRNNYKAAGQVYFLSDGKPINNFEFFRPLFEDLGYTYPKKRLPFNVIFYIAFLTEIVHNIVGRFYNFQPLLTRTEVNKTGITHYFSINKASEELGYKPTVQNDLSQVVKYYQKLGRVKQPNSSKTLKYYFVNVMIFFIIFSIIMSFLPTATSPYLM